MSDSTTSPTDYKSESRADRLTKRFGAQLIDETLLEKFRRVTGETTLHPFLERGLFFAHRDLGPLLDRYEKGEPFYLYTGRGPSTRSMHIGHLIPFEITAYLQRVFKVPVVIEITDDEKQFTRRVSREEIREFAEENIRDIRACGFDPERTFIFKNTDYYGQLYENVCRLMLHFNINQMKHLFALEDSANLGQLMFPMAQMACCFSSSFPKLFDRPTRCLVICGLDQDVFFRALRDVCPAMKEFKPALLYSNELPSLFGPESAKMSSSDPRGAIYLDDTPKQVKKKIGGCFSGGGVTVDDQRRNGADLSVDVSYIYLSYFHPDLDLVKRVGEAYAKGEMLTGEMKKLVIELLNRRLEEHRSRKS